MSKEAVSEAEVLLPAETRQQRALALEAARTKFAVIRSPSAYAEAGEYLTGVQALIQQIERWYQPHKRRAKATHQGLCDEETQLLSPLKEVLISTKQSMGRWSQREKEKARARAAEATASLPAGSPAAVPQSRVPEVSGISERTTFTFTITDLAKLPREYLMPDEKKIGKLVRAIGKDAEKTCPGITVAEETGIAARAAKDA